MEDASKALLAAALAGGYVLGRTKKARLALSLASYLGGRRLGLDPRHLVRDGARKLGDIPQVAELGQQLRGEVMAAGRQAATAAAHRGIASLADALHDRTLQLNEGGSSGGDADEEEPSEGDQRGGRGEREGEKGESGRARADRSADGKGATAKKAAARKPEGRKPAERASGERKPAGKKTAGQTAPAKQTARKKAAPGSRQSAERASSREGRRR
ncbi:histone protein [Streptomyces sp. RS10V-4]|uniref:histone protein n=1 Tax=Streptomyces rhizoryzae TaxID=2932493 RepID=UPI0020039A8B|nr:histone protein [Streptomyces rhizoryzae]MCK7624351.1 histone protein [Streptomyces rhizoryzae]